MNKLTIHSNPGITLLLPTVFMVTREELDLVIEHYEGGRKHLARWTHPTMCGAQKAYRKIHQLIGQPGGWELDIQKWR